MRLLAGLEISAPDGLNYTCKTMLLVCSTDLPARALIVNMKAFNGKHSCTTCEDPGEEGSSQFKSTSSDMAIQGTEHHQKQAEYFEGNL